MSAPQPGDKSAGFSGLILGAIALFVILFGIVRHDERQVRRASMRRRRAAEATK